MEIIIKEFNGDGVHIVVIQEMERCYGNSLEDPYVAYRPGLKSWKGWFDVKYFDKDECDISELTDSAEGKVFVVGHQERDSTALIRYHFVGSGPIVWKDR